ncbi:peptidoglycan DD-metalloendopeptidase family protein [Nonomuraea sp. NPDC049141]|uniref:peptidoglycan DD-metalloendopeptidase family protein n=1 Tax=Nonomuraea sp. NPDC049141 TaxID=3155500 RepID=UPI0033D0C38E
MRKGFVTLLTAVAAIATSVVVAQPALAAGPRPDFRAPWPCGQVRDYYHHSGEVANAIDFNIAGSGDLGTPALASAPGTVIDTVTGDPGYGNYVRVDHGGGWTSLVAHLDRITVSRGAWVNAGQELGKVGTTGNSTGPHLHYEQEADGVNQPVIVDGVAMNYDGQTRRHTSGNCGGGGGGSLMLGGSPADFNGDGKEDIVTFTHNASGDVYVALSTGSGFAGTSVKWHDYFSIGGETPLTGDFNGDGKDDIVTFTHGAAADVYVALSDGTKFGTSAKWHDWFAPTGEIPAVGDFNGDGKDDIATFTHNATADDAYVALSTGTGFGPGTKWNDHFVLPGEFPYTGDYNGDGKDDIVTFTLGKTNDVYVGISNTTSFSTGTKWHDFFGLPGEITL